MSDLTDEQWSRVSPLLPAPNRRGRPRVDNRRCLDGVLYMVDNALRWKDLPPRYGCYVTCWRRHRDWTADGTLAKVKAALRH